MQSTPRRLLLATASVLSLGLASSAQTPFTFSIDQSQSNWTYSGTATLAGQTGTIEGNPSNSFQVFGDASGILTGGGSPVATAQFTGANAMVTPDINAKLVVQVPFIGQITVATLVVNNLVLDLQSTVGNVDASGAVTADVTLTMKSGTANVDIVGVGQQIIDLAGLSAPATTFTGLLTGDGSSFTFDTTQLTSSIDVDDPTSGIAATLTVTGQVVASYVCPAALVGSPASISVASGGSQSLSLSTCVEQTSSLYFALGSAGQGPLPVGPGLLLPLSFDAYFEYTLAKPNSAVLQNTFGFLDASGVASASFNLPPGLGPNFVGLKLYHAFVGFNSAFAPSFTSGAVSVDLDA